MSGNHSADGSPIGHRHPHAAASRSRRAFLGDLGKGTIAAAVFTPALLAACGSSDSATSAAEPGAPAAATTSPPTTGSTGSTAPAASEQPAPTAATSADDDSGEAPGLESLTWARTNLGFVSAYVLVRGNTAAIVDTGVSGSATAIGNTLAGLGLNYGDVDHVILTHNHPDHAGSITAVLAEALNATAYAGTADLGVLPADIVGLVGGEDIFGFEMLATPGHTAGHMSVIDHQAGLLVAGDALWTEGGAPVEGPQQYFADVPRSRDSIRSLATLSFNTLLVGHGDPIERAADRAVAALAAALP
jgi:glyoxylase-like metal-dependent hydrolase (beta-lactamase superfamily II)